MPTDQKAVEDLMFVMASATNEELKKHDGDIMPRKDRNGHKIGVQGMILDAMDEGKIDVVVAHRMLCEIQKNLHANTTGLCRVDQHGELVAIGTIRQESAT